MFGFFFLFLVCLGKRLFFKLFNILCVCLCWDICEGSLNSEPREVICWFGNLMVIISTYPSVGCCTSQAPLPALLVLNVISSSRRFALCFAVFKAPPLSIIFSISLTRIYGKPVMCQPSRVRHRDLNKVRNLPSRSEKFNKKWQLCKQTVIII